MLHVKRKLYFSTHYSLDNDTLTHFFDPLLIHHFNIIFLIHYVFVTMDVVLLENIIYLAFEFELIKHEIQTLDY